ncbi:MAG: DUF45 domain-containing protein [Candidatus Handelsmanbacteria bacterium]|nr:DUF45 domain-containing protein [Candidatus Handelsmanbacteria bacterium]
MKLSGGYIRVFTSSRQYSVRIKGLVDTCYRTRARTKLRERFQHCCEKIQRYDVPPSYMAMRRMTTPRRCSCTPSRRILVNSQLVQSPTYCID